MYSLTDYSEQELRWLAEITSEEIGVCKEIEKGYENQEPLSDTFTMLADALAPGFMTAKRQANAEKLKFLREHNVHVLTALQIVRDREKVLNN